jgi:hypothetical protein
LVPQRQIFEHQGAAGSEHAEEAWRMRVIMPAIIDQAGRQFNADNETDGVSRGHTARKRAALKKKQKKRRACAAR